MVRRIPPRILTMILLAVSICLVGIEPGAKANSPSVGAFNPRW